MLFSPKSMDELLTSIIWSALLQRQPRWHRHARRALRSLLAEITQQRRRSGLTDTRLWDTEW